MTPRRLAALEALAAAVREVRGRGPSHPLPPHAPVLPPLDLVAAALLDLDLAEAAELWAGADPAPRLRQIDPFHVKPRHPWRSTGNLRRRP